MKLSNILSIVGIVLLFGAGMFCGYKIYPKVKPCPTITVDTIPIVDSSWHYLKDSLENANFNLKKELAYWKAHRDTIKLPGDSIPVPIDVDTAAILKDYFSTYKYGWFKEDDSIAIKDSVTITQNIPIKHNLYYQFKKPFETIINNIDNSITYNSYLQAGLYVPVYNLNSDSSNFRNINNLQLELTYTGRKGYLGVGYQPLNNTFGLRVGGTIFKFKKKR